MFSQTAIDVIGWIYFVAWSLSFYGQLILNYRLKRYIHRLCSVEGMNLDYLAMNVTGFTFYSLYCSYGYFFPDGHLSTGTVDLNDLLFAYHAIIVTLLTAVQAFIYPHGLNRIMKKTVAFLIFLWAFSIFYAALTFVQVKTNLGLRNHTAISKGERVQHHGVLQAINFLSEISSSDVLELEKEIYSWLEYLQYPFGLHWRTFLFPADGNGD